MSKLPWIINFSNRDPFEKTSKLAGWRRPAFKNGGDFDGEMTAAHPFRTEAGRRLVPNRRHRTFGITFK